MGGVISKRGMGWVSWDSHCCRGVCRLLTKTPLFFRRCCLGTSKKKGLESYPPLQNYRWNRSPQKKEKKKKRIRMKEKKKKK